MRGDLIYELIGGIREDFVQEAEPMCLLKLWDPSKEEGAKSQTESSMTYLVTDSRSSPQKPSRGMRHWLAAACVALAVLLTGAGSVALIGGLASSGDVGVSSIFGSDFIHQLLPFLSPHTEPPYEAPIRQPGETEAVAEAETRDLFPPESETEPETELQTKHPCADGHDEEILMDRAASCYAVSRLHTVCRVCGLEQDVYGEEMLPHSFQDGYCTVCDLIEGAHPAENCSFSLYDSGAYRLDELTGDIGDTLILPNVYFTEENGLRPVKVIGDHLLANRCEFSTLVLPKSVHTIEHTGAFSGCSSLETIVWPENLKSIGLNAFTNCVSLTEITLPDTVVEVGGWLFSGCTSLKKAVLPDNLTSMGQSIFERCTALTDVTLPANLLNLPVGMFARCSSLETVTLPEKLQVIDMEAFYDCVALTHVDMPDSVECIRASAFMYCGSLKQLRLSDGLTQIMSHAFMGSGIKELVLPENLLYIEFQAFTEANIRELTLPASLIRVDSEAFANCATLQTVTYAGTVQEWEKLFRGSLSIPVQCVDGTVPPPSDSAE